MEPRTYLIFITLIALLIMEDLNEAERLIIYRFTLNVAYAMGAIVDQEVILEAYHLKTFQREQGAALQKDFDTLYAEINRLKKEISRLKS
jgi:cell division protein FtsB